MMSVPGSDQQKMQLTNCVSCHTVERIVRSTHDADEFANLVLPRMGSYATRACRAMCSAGRPSACSRNAATSAGRPSWRQPIPRQHQSERKRHLEIRAQDAAAAKGRATHVIMTNTSAACDGGAARRRGRSAGIAWYSNFGEQTFGKLDPKTGKVTEFPVPELKKGWPTGMLGLRADKDDNMWIGMMYQGAIAKFDPKAEKFQIFNLPPEMNKDMAQVNMVRAESVGVDGKVWSQNNGFAAVHRLDVASGVIETIAPFKNAGVGENHNIYDIIPTPRTTFTSPTSPPTISAGSIPRPPRSSSIRCRPSRPDPGAA